MNVEALGQYCFYDSQLEVVTFEPEFKLMRVEKHCFSEYSLKSILIPCSVTFVTKDVS